MRLRFVVGSAEHLPGTSCALGAGSGAGNTTGKKHRLCPWRTWGLPGECRGSPGKGWRPERRSSCCFIYVPASPALPQAGLKFFPPATRPDDLSFGSQWAFFFFLQPAPQFPWQGCYQSKRVLLWKSAAGAGTPAWVASHGFPVSNLLLRVKGSKKPRVT